MNNEEQVDLSDAFKKSEDKNEGWGAIKYYHDPNTPKAIQYTMKLSGGLVKNEKQAEYVLIGVVSILIITSLFLISSVIRTDKFDPDNYPHGLVLPEET